MKSEEKQEQPGRRSGRGLLITGVILAVLVIGAVLILTQFQIETIQVTGNVHYTDEEMIQKVVGDGNGRNSLILYLRSKLQPEEEIPFIEKIDVEYISRHVVTITVYEKALAGCVEFMNEYMYFDKDGIILESSPEKMSDIPCITGIHFDTMVMYEPLPIEDETFFHTVLTLTQLLQKYDLQIDNIQFTANDEIILYHQEIEIQLGDGSNIEEQVGELGNILQSIEGKSGTLYMKDYSVEDASVIFREND